MNLFIKFQTSAISHIHIRTYYVHILSFEKLFCRYYSIGFQDRDTLFFYQICHLFPK